MDSRCLTFGAGLKADVGAAKAIGSFRKYGIESEVCFCRSKFTRAKMKL
jgi:hypothetical protein